VASPKHQPEDKQRTSIIIHLNPSEYILRKKH
jgi:hypothetical protein